MKKKTGILSKIYIAILLIFLYSPIAVLIFYSFNNGKTTVWKGFTFKWYVQLFRDDNIMNALWNTVIIAVLASVLQQSSELPPQSASAISRAKKECLFRMLQTFRSSADIVMGVSLMLLFTTLGVIFNFEMGFFTVLISHICFCVPFVVLNVMPRIKRMDQSIYDAALDLGCNQWQAFYKVIIHELMPVFSRVCS